MPIKQFTADVAPEAQIPYGERRRREPELGMAQAGMQVERAGAILANTLDANQQFAANQDVQASYKDASEFHMKAVQKLDEMRQGGNFDPNAYNEWLTQTGDDYRQKRTTNAGLQRWDTHAMSIYGTMGHMANEADIQQASENAVNDANQTVQTDGLLLQRFPTQLRATLEKNQQQIMDLPNNVPIQQKQKLILHMNARAAMNAAQGWIEANPYTAKDHINNDDDISKFIDPNERELLLDRSDTKMRAIEAQQIKVREDQDRQWKITRDQTMNDAFVAMYKGTDKSGQPFDANSVEKLSKQLDQNGRPVIDPSDTHVMLNYLMKEAKEGPAKDNENYLVNAWPRVYSNNMPMDEWQQAASNRDISTTTFERGVAKIAEGTTIVKSLHAQALTNAKQKFGFLPGMEGIAPPASIAAFNQYSQALHEAEQQAKDGKGGSATDVYMPGGKAETLLQSLTPQDKMPTADDQIQTAIRNKTPIPMADGKWIVIDSIDANGKKVWHEVGKQAPGAAPNAGVPASAVPREMSNNSPTTGVKEADREQMSEDLSDAFTQYKAAKTPQDKDRWYNRYLQLEERWKQLPTRVEQTEIEKDAQENEKAGIK